jgi:murein DD-endopeptidase MepM/ murein hydrolase activator NlpD
MGLIRLTTVICLVLCLSNVLASGYAVRVVAPGDSLGAIANRYYVSLEAVMEFNSFVSELLHPGDLVNVPYLSATGGIDEAAPQPPEGFSSYVLQHGETLSDVASYFGLSIDALIGANPDISSLDILPAGLEILVPPSEGLVVTLEPNQSIIALLKHYDMSPLAFMKANSFASPDEIKPGVMVFLPNVKPVQALARLAKVREEEKRYVWPVHGRITSYFGRRNLGMGTSNFHSAIDVAAPTGTKVVAARSGTVIYASWSNRGYGKLIKIEHSGGAETWYAHNSKILVEVGQYVNQGEVIARVGSTGLSTGPHLHFEVHEGGKPIDPLTYLN